MNFTLQTLLANLLLSLFYTLCLYSAGTDAQLRSMLNTISGGRLFSEYGDDDDEEEEDEYYRGGPPRGYGGPPPGAFYDDYDRYAPSFRNYRRRYPYADEEELLY